MHSNLLGFCQDHHHITTTTNDGPECQHIHSSYPSAYLCCYYERLLQKLGPFPKSEAGTLPRQNHSQSRYFGSLPIGSHQIDAYLSFRLACA